MRVPGSFVRQIMVVLAPVLMLGGCAQLGNGQIESGNGGSSVTSSSGSGGVGSANGTGSGGSGSSSGTGSGGSSGTGSGGSSGTGSGGSSGTGSGGSSGSQIASDLPCDVASVLASKCVLCHGTPVARSAPMSLTNYAQMTAKAASDPTKTNAEVAVSRMMNTSIPMPPTGYPQATSADIATLQNWISAGYPMTGCSTVTTTPADAGTPPPDPFAVAPTCTSGKMWTQGTNGSSSMQPGVACINCHKSTGGEAPTFTIAGTLYPTAHEPDQCNGVNGTTDGAQVVITDANNKTVTITPNSVGNFSYTGAVATPFHAKVTYMGGERDMVAGQTSGDCNACHTQNGTMSAPGRIILP